MRAGTIRHALMSTGTADGLRGLLSLAHRVATNALPFCAGDAAGGVCRGVGGGRVGGYTD
jgi:hypothetical protein